MERYLLWRYWCGWPASGHWRGEPSGCTATCGTALPVCWRDPRGWTGPASSPGSAADSCAPDRETMDVQSPGTHNHSSQSLYLLVEYHSSRHSAFLVFTCVGSTLPWMIILPVWVWLCPGWLFYLCGFDFALDDYFTWVGWTLPWMIILPGWDRLRPGWLFYLGGFDFALDDYFTWVGSTSPWMMLRMEM